MTDVDSLVATAEAPWADPDALRVALEVLLDRSPGIGAAVGLGLLAREPRTRPSRGLLIDPDDRAFVAWQRRVVAAAALVSSPAVIAVWHELRDEFAEDPGLASAALALARPHAGLSPQRRSWLSALAGPTPG